MKKKISVLIKNKIKKFNKTIKVASDKSLSLRALMLASQCIGISKIKNLLESEDVINCLKALRTLGVKIVKKNNIYFIYGNGLSSFKPAKKALYAGQKFFNDLADSSGRDFSELSRLVAFAYGENWLGLSN